MKDSERRVKEWLTGEVEKLQTESQQEDWQTIREAINDPALMSSSVDVFTLHMQFIYLQLLMGCAVKMCSGGLSEMRRNPQRYMRHVDELTEPISMFVSRIEDGERISLEYSDAYGSSPTRSCAAMLVLLENKVMTGIMSGSAANFLEQHLVATHVAYKDAVERAYGAVHRPVNPVHPSGKCVSGTSVARKGQGCLICVVGSVMCGFVLTQILRISLCA